MGYYMMPQADESEIDAICKEAARIFIKSHGLPVNGLHVDLDIERQVIRVTNKETGTYEMFTFAELGFL